MDTYVGLLNDLTSDYYDTGTVLHIMFCQAYAIEGKKTNNNKTS